MISLRITLFRAVITTAARILRTGRGTDYIRRLGFISRIAVFFCAVYGVGFFRLVIEILRGAAFGVTELRANLLLAFTLARADGEVFFKVGYYIVALIGR